MSLRTSSRWARLARLATLVGLVLGSAGQAQTTQFGPNRPTLPAAHQCPPGQVCDPFGQDRPAVTEPRTPVAAGVRNVNNTDNPASIAEALGVLRSPTGWPGGQATIDQVSGTMGGEAVAAAANRMAASGSGDGSGGWLGFLRAFAGLMATFAR